MPFKKYVEEEPEEDKFAAKKSKGYRRKKVFIAVGFTLLTTIVVIVIVIFVSRALGRKNEPTAPAKDESLSRLDCLPWRKGLNLLQPKRVKDECQRQNVCIYEPIDSDPRIPACFFNVSAVKMRLMGGEDTSSGKSFSVELSRKGSQAKKIKVDFEYLEDYVLRFKIYRPNEEDKYEVPFEFNKPRTRTKYPKYEVEVDMDTDNFAFKIIRKSTKSVLWDNSVGPLIYDKLNRQISTYLPSKNIYGLGENNHRSFRHNLNYQSWPIWSRSQDLDSFENANLYGAHPFYTCMEEDGKSHGVLLYNSNAMEYELLPHPALTFRTTGGVFDFYMFLGPEPENVVQQFTQYVGRTFMPPYWALGFQISRYGYKDLAEIRSLVGRFRNHSIPLDALVIGSDTGYYEKKPSRENWANVSDFMNGLRRSGVRTIMSVESAMTVSGGDAAALDTSYEMGRMRNVFVTWPIVSPDFNETNSHDMLAHCSNDRKVFPDFFKSSTKKWWSETMSMQHDVINFDGLNSFHNVPSLVDYDSQSRSETCRLSCPDDEYELVKTKASYLYRETNKLSDRTLCMIGQQGENNQYKHFDVHNLYGLSESIQTFDAARRLTGTRGLVISGSTFIGSGKYVGHALGDNQSLWSHLYYSIIGMLEFNLFGISYVGADICGFGMNTTKELCARWSQLGAFYPLARNHNDENSIDQDPAALGEPVISAAKRALNIRYELLPYYYTLFYKSHSFGNTVVRPLFHEFPFDNRTYEIDKQFLVGQAIMVVPVITEHARMVEAYFPSDLWYSYYDGSVIDAGPDAPDTDEDEEDESNDLGVWRKLEASIDFIPVYIRGGHVIPLQGKANSTDFSRKTPFELIVTPNPDGEAVGDLFYDDGLSRNINDNYYYSTFILRDNVLKMSIEHNTYAVEMANLYLNKVRLMIKVERREAAFLAVYVNKAKKLSKKQVQVNANEVVLSDLGLKMNMPFDLRWGFNLTDSFQKPNQSRIHCFLSEDEITESQCLVHRCEFARVNSRNTRCYLPLSLTTPTMNFNRELLNLTMFMIENFRIDYKTFMPFLLSLYSEVNLNGGTMIRTLLNEFPDDARAIDMEQEFMLGSRLLVSPIIDPNKLNIYEYFPQARWFNYYSGKEVSETNRIHEVDVSIDNLPIHVRGGSVLLTAAYEPGLEEDAPDQPKKNQTSYTLIIAPSQPARTERSVLVYSFYEHDPSSALPIDQPNLYEFQYELYRQRHNITISVKSQNPNLELPTRVESIRIFGTETEPTSIVLDNTKYHAAYEYNRQNRELYIFNLDIQLAKITKPVSISIK